MVFGWLIPSLFVMTIAASMAEMASSMPYAKRYVPTKNYKTNAMLHFRTSAGLYYFSAKLAPPRYSALASWITGWANITGQVSLVCSIDFTWCE
jgi:amino acid transporter